MPSVRIASALGFVLSGGCRSTRPPAEPFPSPTSLFQTDTYPGTALSGPVAGAAASFDPADALSVRVTLIALEYRPNLPYSPVGGRAVFFSSTGGSGVVLPGAELTRGTTIADVDSGSAFFRSLRAARPGRTATMATLDGALPPGVTADFAALDSVPVTDPVTGHPARRRLDILVARPVDRDAPQQIALVVKDVVRSAAGDFNFRTEKALFDLPAGVPTNTAIVVPFRFELAASHAVAILVQIAPPGSDPAHLAATRRAGQQVAAHLAAAPVVLSTGETSVTSVVASALTALQSSDDRRSSLTFLAEQTHAPVCEDLALEADDALLDRFVRDAEMKIAAKPSAAPGVDVGWLLDQTALETLDRALGAAANGAASMPPELMSILTAHTGEVGRHPSSMDELLRGLTSRAELDNRLLAENTIYLQDSSPQSRVRAFDWLNARHHAPDGYDPLGPGKARRTALEHDAGTP